MRIRRVLGIAALAIVSLVIVLAGLAFWSLRSTLPRRPQLPGTIERGSLVHGGRTRTWLAYLPKNRQQHPAVVIALHGSMGTAAQARQVYGFDFDRLAEQHGFLAVYPQGYEGHWNDARVKGPFAAKVEHVDDTGFLHALVEQLVREHGADREHVFVTGVSNGGQMTLRLALETPRFARAYAPVVASMPAPENLAVTPKREPVSILFMNGDADPMNPWDGGDVELYGVWGNRGRVLSAHDTVAYFCQLAGLAGPPISTPLPDVDRSDGSTAERQLWSEPGKPGVELVAIRGGGHGVPHPATRGMRLLGRSNRDFHAAEEIWAFFARSW